MPRSTHRASIRFQDVDAAGIMFFARVFDLFHDAFVAHLRAHGVRLDEVLKARVWGAPLVHVEADYARPLSFADEVDIEVDLAARGETSITLSYVVSRRGDVCVRGVTKHAFIDRTTGRPRPIPPEIDAAFSP